MDAVEERSTREPLRDEGALPAGRSTQDPRRETAGEDGVREALRVATDMTLLATTDTIAVCREALLLREDEAAVRCKPQP